MDTEKDIVDEIARVAYEIYEKTGITGREVEHWLEAERIVLERLSFQESSKEVKKLTPSKKKGGTKKKEIEEAKV